MKRLAFVMAVLLLAGMTLGGEEAPRRDWNLNRALLKIRAIRDAESIVLARIKSVHKSPGIWCGFLVTRQEVTYEVVEHLHGEKITGTVRIGHLLVSGSGTVLKEVPHLRWNMFYPGARAVLCLKRSEGAWTAVEDAFGVILVDPPISPDPDVREICGLTLGLPSLRPYFHSDQPGRLPVRVAIYDVMRLPLDIEMFGKKVTFAHPEALEGEPFLVFTTFEKGEGKALVRFRYDVEGVRGEARFVKKEGRWVVARDSVVEE